MLVESKLTNNITGYEKKRIYCKDRIGHGGGNAAFSRELFAEAKNDPQKPLDIAAIFGGTAAEMFERGIAEMGGMGRFVKKGDSVVIKPNIGWDQPPEVGANTDPDLVGLVVKNASRPAQKKYCASTTLAATTGKTDIKSAASPKKSNQTAEKWSPETTNSCLLTTTFPAGNP